MPLDRIVLRLDKNIPFELEILQAYNAMSRPRRQEWMRSLLRSGVVANNGMAFEPAGSVLAQAPKAPERIAPAPPLAIPAQVLAPTSLTELTVSPTAAQPTAVAKAPAKRSAAALGGFLPEMTANAAKA